ncbi:unnamed protein product, partial [Allacma fusca]
MIKQTSRNKINEIDQEYEELVINKKLICQKLSTSVSTSLYGELSLRRNKTESPEQRNERKNFRKKRRMERKANMVAFRDEAKRQEKVMLNAKGHLQGFK